MAMQAIDRGISFKPRYEPHDREAVRAPLSFARNTRGGAPARPLPGHRAPAPLAPAPRLADSASSKRSPYVREEGVDLVEGSGVEPGAW